MLWGFVEWRTSNLSGCLLFLHSLNSPLSGSVLLGVRDKNQSTWYQVTCSPEKTKWPVSEHTPAVPAPLELSRACFFSSCASFSRLSRRPLLFHTPLQSAFVERQFTFHRIVWRNARQEGRGQNNGFHGNKAKKPTQSCLLLLSCLRSKFVMDSRWAVYFLKILWLTWAHTSFLCLFNLFLFWKQICRLVSVNFSGWLFLP